MHKLPDRPAAPVMLQSWLLRHRLKSRGWSLALSCALGLSVSCCVLAQTAPTEIADEFPADTQTLTAQQLKDRLGGHRFKASPKKGLSWRAQFKGDYVFVNVSSGANDSGTWRTEDGKLCVDYQRFPSGCSEMRASDKDLYLKNRVTGEVIWLENND